MRRFIFYSTLFAILALGSPLLILAAKVGQPAPDFTARPAITRPITSRIITESSWFLSGTTTAALTHRNITIAGICRSCKNSGRRKASFGSRSSLRRRANRDMWMRTQRIPTWRRWEPRQPQPCSILTGAIGHSFDAKTTPQMVVINPQGVIIYDGAIDNRPTDDLKDIAGATNYVNLALGEALAGKPVETAATRPYGCSVKYKGSWF